MLKRKLGVHGINGPTIKSKTVQASNFSIGALIGFFERKYLRAFQVHNSNEELEIFGNYVDPNFYGKDVMKTFWNNLKGQSASMFVKSHVGNDGTNVDAVVASSTAADSDSADTALALAEDIQTKFNAHAADATQHTTAIDNVNFPETTEIEDLVSLLVFTNLMITAYSIHEDDAALTESWVYHKGKETGTHALTSEISVTDLPTAITMLNDMKDKMNAHDADASAHGKASLHQITADNATSTPDPTLKMQSAYKGELDYGVSGNRTGYTIESGTRFTTAVAASVSGTDTSITLDSVIGIKAGDIVKFALTGGTVYRKITSIDESAKKVFFTTAIGENGVVSDVVTVPGFKIHTWRKSLSGIVIEVETSLGNSWCTMEPEVTQFYVENVHNQNRWMKITNQNSPSAGIDHYPADVTTVTYLTAGVNGTPPTTSAHWAMDLTALDGLPVRFIALPETSDIFIQKSIETYCKSRDDIPFVIGVVPDNQTMSQLEDLGSKYQRSDEVLFRLCDAWLGVDDPYNNAPNAPDRFIPNVGAVMAAWIQNIAILGIHYDPSTDAITLIGINSLDNSNLGIVDDDDRTEIANYGINLIQFINGSGYRIRNFFTPSTDPDGAFEFSNGALMRNFIKLSCQDSLSSSENTPNGFSKIKADHDAIQSFMYQLWYKGSPPLMGSTGSVPEGETFGQQQNPDGTLTQPSDHFEVISDVIANPQPSINAGNRNHIVNFTFPTAAGSIDISVGLMIR